MILQPAVQEIPEDFVDRLNSWANGIVELERLRDQLQETRSDITEAVIIADEADFDQRGDLLASIFSADRKIVDVMISLRRLVLGSNN